MTWIIGRAGPFGHAVGVSDIRVTLNDGTEFDCLQKIFKISSQLVLGFAGSVKIGLEAVASLSYALTIPAGEKGSWDPIYIAEGLPIGTRKLFEMSPDQEKSLGCELMLLSAHPTRNDGPAPWARCYVHRFYAPDFEPIEAAPAQIVSIGSGANVKPYTEALEALGIDFEMFKLEVGFPGGSGIALLSSLSSLLRRSPQSGISRHLHLYLVGRDEVRFGDNSHEFNSEDENAESMPPVARNWDELRHILGDLSSSALEGARC